MHRVDGIATSTQKATGNTACSYQATWCSEMSNRKQNWTSLQKSFPVRYRSTVSAISNQMSFSVSEAEWRRIRVNKSLTEVPAKHRRYCCRLCSKNCGHEDTHNHTVRTTVRREHRKSAWTGSKQPPCPLRRDCPGCAIFDSRLMFSKTSHLGGDAGCLLGFTEFECC